MSDKLFLVGLDHQLARAEYAVEDVRAQVHSKLRGNGWRPRPALRAFASELLQTSRVTFERIIATLIALGIARWLGMGL